ncbi:MAG: threonine/serine dehydratase [Rhodospirillales bacterium]|nr:threonine/serine dehydratase [Rhodospirillales bacterium]
MSLLTASDIAAAAARIEGAALRTPLLQAPMLDARIGTPVLLKVEALQRTGSFKFRGAYNRLVQLNDVERKAGVVAFSSGNHAQGVAAAAQLLGIPATIVMPHDAPAIKVANTRSYGAEIVLYDRARESREEIAARLAAERGATLVPSFDDLHVMAGQGTAGLELMQQAAELGVDPGAVYVPAGGGGLIAGCSTAIKAARPATEIYAVEPAGFDDHRRSLAAGTRVGIEAGARSFCDALLAPEPGELTFAINRATLAGGLAVTDDEVARAIAFAFRNLKLVLEPGGAVALAAALAGKTRSDVPIVLVCSGGNVEAEIFADCISRYPDP